MQQHFQEKIFMAAMHVKRGGTLTYLEPDELAKFGVNETIISDKKNNTPYLERLLLNIEEAAELLSMSSQALRDLIHKGQGPSITRRGKRTCFTISALEHYVASLPREHTKQGIIEIFNQSKRNPLSIEERRAFNHEF